MSKGSGPVVGFCELFLNGGKVFSQARTRHALPFDTTDHIACAVGMAQAQRSRNLPTRGRCITPREPCGRCASHIPSTGFAQLVCRNMVVPGDRFQDSPQLQPAEPLGGRDFIGVSGMA
jgi:hypothetical protein